MVRHRSQSIQVARFVICESVYLFFLYTKAQFLNLRFAVGTRFLRNVFEAIEKLPARVLSGIKTPAPRVFKPDKTPLLDFLTLL